MTDETQNELAKQLSKEFNGKKVLATCYYGRKNCCKRIEHIDSIYRYFVARADTIRCIFNVKNYSRGPHECLNSNSMYKQGFLVPNILVGDFCLDEHAPMKFTMKWFLL